MVGTFHDIFSGNGLFYLFALTIKHKHVFSTLLLWEDLLMSCPSFRRESSSSSTCICVCMLANTNNSNSSLQTMPCFLLPRCQNGQIFQILFGVTSGGIEFTPTCTKG